MSLNAYTNTCIDESVVLIWIPKYKHYDRKGHPLYCYDTSVCLAVCIGNLYTPRIYYTCIVSYLHNISYNESAIETIESPIVLLSLRFEVSLMHIPYTVEFINRKLTNRIDFKQVTYVISYSYMVNK